MPPYGVETVVRALRKVANRKFELTGAVLMKMTLWDVAELLREIADELEKGGGTHLVDGKCFECGVLLVGPVCPKCTPNIGALQQPPSPGEDHDGR